MSDSISRGTARIVSVSSGNLDLLNCTLFQILTIEHLQKYMSPEDPSSYAQSFMVRRDNCLSIFSQQKCITHRSVMNNCEELLIATITNARVWMLSNIVSVLPINTELQTTAIPANAHRTRFTLSHIFCHGQQLYRIFVILCEDTVPVIGIYH